MSDVDVLAFLHAYRLPVLAVVLTVILLTAAWLNRDRSLDSMPGPKGNPLTGIGTSLPPNAPTQLRKWAAEYGEIFKMRVGWYNWVVINSPEAFKEILDRQVCKFAVLQML